MIKLTILGKDKNEIFLNPHQIEYIEDSINPTLIMLSGKRIRVNEDIKTIIGRIVAYRRRIGIFKNEE